MVNPRYILYFSSLGVKLAVHSDCRVTDGEGTVAIKALSPLLPTPIRSSTRSSVPGCNSLPRRTEATVRLMALYRCSCPGSSDPAAEKPVCSSTERSVRIVPLCVCVCAREGFFL